MFDEVDETLRRLLERELPVENNEIEITFDQPKREWSSRLSRPTLNLFLYTLHENKKLRQTQPLWETEVIDGNNVLRRRGPLRIDLCYLVTAWATEPEDEHRLLARSLIVLSRYAHLPVDLLQETLKNQTKPIPFRVGQDEDLKDPNPADLWGALDNEWRPAYTCILTLEIEPFLPLTFSMVRQREVRFGPATETAPGKLGLEGAPRQSWSIGGSLLTNRSMTGMRLRLLETGQVIPVSDEGHFAISKLQAGEYTLEILVEGDLPRRHKITVPGADYDFEV